MIEKHINKILDRPPYHVDDDIKRIHDQLTIVDLHADSLLWNRDLLVRNSFGHMDIPRLFEGNVAIQVFGVATKFTVGTRLGRLSLNVDLIRLLSLIDSWPRPTRDNLFQRAVYQSNKLHDLIARSNGRMMLIRSVNDLDHFLNLRKSQQGMVGALLGLEGAHALNGELDNLDKLYELSLRVFGISHFSNNEAGGSAHDKGNRGLTTWGRTLIQKLQEMHMVVDLSHVSNQVLDEVVDMVSGPVVVSHTGVCGTCNNSRNLNDDQLKKIASTGGIIGIAMFEKAVCGRTIKDVVHSIRYVSDLVGEECISIGSDFDGAITAPVDASGLALLTEALLHEGFNTKQIAKIMGENALRVLRRILPKE